MGVYDQKSGKVSQMVGNSHFVCAKWVFSSGNDVRRLLVVFPSGLLGLVWESGRNSRQDQPSRCYSRFTDRSFFTQTGKMDGKCENFADFVCLMYGLILIDKLHIS